ncbi:hypothetical protein [Bradyrhizobium guangdongense]
MNDNVTFIGAKQVHKPAANGGRHMRFGDVLSRVSDVRARAAAIAQAENKRRGRERNADDIADMREAAREVHAFTDQERGVVMAAGFNPDGDDAWLANTSDLGRIVPDAEMRARVRDETAHSKEYALAKLADATRGDGADPVKRSMAWLLLANVLGIPIGSGDLMRLIWPGQIERMQEESASRGSPLQTYSRDWHGEADMPAAMRAIKHVTSGSAETTASTAWILAALLFEAMEGRPPNDAEHAQIYSLFNPEREPR